jgi:hypothetical protein
MEIDAVRSDKSLSINWNFPIKSEAKIKFDIAGFKFHMEWNREQKKNLSSAEIESIMLLFSAIPDAIGCDKVDINYSLNFASFSFSAFGSRPDPKRTLHAQHRKKARFQLTI